MIVKGDSTFQKNVKIQGKLELDGDISFGQINGTPGIYNSINGKFTELTVVNNLTIPVEIPEMLPADGDKIDLALGKSSHNTGDMFLKNYISHQMMKILKVTLVFDVYLYIKAIVGICLHLILHKYIIYHMKVILQMKRVME